MVLHTDNHFNRYWEKINDWRNEENDLQQLFMMIVTLGVAVNPECWLRFPLMVRNFIDIGIKS